MEGEVEPVEDSRALRARGGCADISCAPESYRQAHDPDFRRHLNCTFGNVFGWWWLASPKGCMSGRCFSWAFASLMHPQSIFRSSCFAASAARQLLVSIFSNCWHSQGNFVRAGKQGSDVFGISAHFVRAGKQGSDVYIYMSIFIFILIFIYWRVWNPSFSGLRLWPRSSEPWHLCGWLHKSSELRHLSVRCPFWGNKVHVDMDDYG